MTAIYKTYNELKGNTLTYGDKVIFVKDEHIYTYTADYTHIFNTDGSNTYIFERLGYKTESERTAFVTECIGYKAYSGGCPTTNYKDYDALTKIALGIFAKIEGIHIDTTREPESVSCYITIDGKTMSIETIKNDIKTKSDELKVLKKNLKDGLKAFEDVVVANKPKKKATKKSKK
jgi:hypothetical protein